MHHTIRHASHYPACITLSGKYVVNPKTRRNRLTIYNNNNTQQWTYLAWTGRRNISIRHDFEYSVLVCLVFKFACECLRNAVLLEGAHGRPPEQNIMSSGKQKWFVNYTPLKDRLTAICGGKYDVNCWFCDVRQCQHCSVII